MRPSLPLSLLLHQEKRKIRNHGILYVILNRKFGGQITPVNGFNRGRNTIFPTHTTRKSSYEKKLFTIHSQSIPIKKEETIKSQFSAQLIIINVIFFIYQNNSIYGLQHSINFLLLRQNTHDLIYICGQYKHTPMHTRQKEILDNSIVCPSIFILIKINNSRYYYSINIMENNESFTFLY